MRLLHRRCNAGDEIGVVGSVFCSSATIAFAAKTSHDQAVLYFSSPLKSASLNGIFLHGAQKYGTVVERRSRRDMLAGEKRQTATKPAMALNFFLRTHVPANSLLLF